MSRLEKWKADEKRFAPNGVHPERKVGEVWLCNVSPDSEIGWKNYRLGETAFCDGGDRIAEDLKPLFVSEKELSEVGDYVGLHGLSLVIREKMAPYWCADEYKIVRPTSNITKVVRGATGTDGKVIYLDLGDSSFCMSPEIAKGIFVGLGKEVAKVEAMNEPYDSLRE